MVTFFEKATQMKISLSVLLLLSLSFSFAQTAPPANYQLVFTDEFEDGEIDGDIWWKAGHCWMHGPIGGENSPQECCERNFYKTENVIEQDGKLKLIAKREAAPCPDSSAHKFCQNVSHEMCENEALQYSSGWVHSGNAEWLYGYYEISCKIPQGKGFWPAFWFHGRNPDAYREIDVFEFCGVNTSVFQYTLHQDANYNGVNDNEYRQNQHDEEVPAAHSQFLKYGVLWEKDFVQLFFDGKPSKKFKNRILNEPMHLILNLAVNGCFQVNRSGGKCFANCDTPKEGIFEIEYVKVWQKKDKPQFEILGLEELCVGEKTEFQIVSTQGANYLWSGSSGLKLSGDYIQSVPGGLNATGKFEATEPGMQKISLTIEYNSGFSEKIEKEIRVVEFAPQMPQAIELQYKSSTCIYSLKTDSLNKASSYFWKINDSFYTSESPESRHFFHAPDSPDFLELEVLSKNSCGESRALTSNIQLPERNGCKKGISKLIFEPNPIRNSGRLSVRFENNIEMTEQDVKSGILRVFNINGQKVMELKVLENGVILDTASLPGGMYHALFIGESFEAKGVFVKD